MLNHEVRTINASGKTMSVQHLMMLIRHMRNTEILLITLQIHCLMVMNVL